MQQLKSLKNAPLPNPLIRLLFHLDIIGKLNNDTDSLKVDIINGVLRILVGKPGILVVDPEDEGVVGGDFQVLQFGRRVTGGFSLPGHVKWLVYVCLATAKKKTEYGKILRDILGRKYEKFLNGEIFKLLGFKNYGSYVNNFEFL